MKTFRNALLPLFLAVGATPALAQKAVEEGAPRLQISRDADGRTTATAAATMDGTGVLLLLGSLDARMHSLGLGLPSILAHSQVMAFTFTEGEAISVSAPWPPLPVFLQALHVRFHEDLTGLEAGASRVEQVGEPNHDELPPPDYLEDGTEARSPRKIEPNEVMTAKVDG